MIFRLLVHLAALPLCVAELSTQGVHQNPPDILKDPGENVVINCSHSNSNFNIIRWYKQSTNSRDMLLIGYVRYDSAAVEKSSQADGLGIEVHQSPPALIRSSGDKVQLFCTHMEIEYRVMLWYQQPPGQAHLKLIGLVDYSTVSMEEPYKQQFNISGDLSRNDAKNVSLLFQPTGAGDSAVYYCAARFARQLKVRLLLTKTPCLSAWNRQPPVSVVCHVGYSDNLSPLS
ncbi:hypothetical protein Q5P01_016728 [Channa striata]|uniref:Ig-like domain-containing protein n=1 Tax=Channa striata TaxID=64152 RepID=A0AA88M826_CHASR|nr:hypothetical protein Q5P01_016728 [Channa striata]